MLTLNRIPKWRGAMQDNIAVAAVTEFEWGEHDCALFAASHIECVTGVDIGTPFYKQYSTALGAMKVLKQAGYDSLLAMAQDKLPPVSLPKAHVADLALVKNAEGDTGWAIGIYLGADVGLLTPTGYGTIIRSDPRIQFAFAVGYTPNA